MVHRTYRVMTSVSTSNTIRTRTSQRAGRGSRASGANLVMERLLSSSGETNRDGARRRLDHNRSPHFRPFAPLRASAGPGHRPAASDSGSRPAGAAGLDAVEEIGEAEGEGGVPVVADERSVG